MQIDTMYLREHYASLSDEAFAEINPDELVDAARKCYDEEAARRQPAPDQQEEPPETIDVDAPVDSGADDEPAWIDTAACACSFSQMREQTNADRTADACDALRAAGIPCHVVCEELDRERTESPVIEYRVMVPGALALHATSILDRDLFNEDFIEDWKTHLEELPDRDLGALDPRIFCAGLLDRAERLKKAYGDELARRKK